VKIEFPFLLVSYPDRTRESDCACAEQGVFFSTSDGFSESDCACAVGEGLDAPPPSAAGRWVLPPTLYRVPLPNGRQLVFNPVRSGAVAVLDKGASAHPRSFTYPYPSTGPLSRRLAALGILVPQEETRRTPFLPPPTLTAWLHLTTRCNLRCAYCYAPRGGIDMSPDVGRAAVDAAFRSALAHGFTVVKIKYAGGEPTLNFSTVQAVHTYAQQRAIRLGIGLDAVLLSNGVALTPSMLEWLQEEEVRLAISLDGMGPAHDRQRPRAEGKGSFEIVVATVDRARAVGLLPHLSVTVTRHNVDRLPEVIAFALDRGLTFNLNFVRPVPGTPDLMPSAKRLIAALRAVVKMMEQHPPHRRIIDGLLDRCDLTGPHRYPCGVGHSYLVVDPRGAVARCHMEMHTRVSTVWEEDPLEAVRATEVGVRNLPVEAKDGCRNCLWRYICAGSCPLLARRLVGREDVRSPYCEVYRTILPELVRAEGMRLL